METSCWIEFRRPRSMRETDALLPLAGRAAED
jgi:hypothetical protein